MVTHDDSKTDGLFSDLLEHDTANTTGDNSNTENLDKKSNQELSATFGFSDFQYINFGTFTYHLREDGRGETVCGLSLDGREFKSSSRKPHLLDPCKTCHGQSASTSNDETIKQLRRTLAKRIDTVVPADSNPGTFSVTELTGIMEAIPTSFPDFEASEEDILYHLSRGVKGISVPSEEPARFDKGELEILKDAIEGIGLIPAEPEIVVTIKKGFIKRTPVSEFKSQHRGGKGFNYIELSSKDIVESASLICMRDHVFCFTSFGKIYDIRGYEIPGRAREEHGVPISEFLSLGKKERVVDVITAQAICDHEYIITITEDGQIKRTSTSDFSNIFSTGIKAVGLEGTELVGAAWTEEKNDIILTSAGGKSIRFKEEDVRPMGRTAKGVGGIELGPDDRLVDLCIIEPESAVQIATITENGFGKQTPVGEYIRQKRLGKGLLDIDTGERNGPVVATCKVSKEQDIIVVTTNGQSIRVPADEITHMGRNTKGVKIVELDADDSVAAVTLVPSE
jgi:hypothetical protein